MPRQVAIEKTHAYISLFLVLLNTPFLKTYYALPRKGKTKCKYRGWATKKQKKQKNIRSKTNERVRKYTRKHSSSHYLTGPDRLEIGHFYAHPENQKIRKANNKVENSENQEFRV